MELEDLDIISDKYVAVIGENLVVVYICGNPNREGRKPKGVQVTMYEDCSLNDIMNKDKEILHRKLYNTVPPTIKDFKEIDEVIRGHTYPKALKNIDIYMWENGVKKYIRIEAFSDKKYSVREMFADILSHSPQASNYLARKHVLNKWR